MRKGALILAVLLAASFSTAADAAKKKRAEAPKADPAMAATDNSARFVRDALMPWQAQPATATPAKAAVKGKKKRGRA
jgi:hypothetical protein